MAVRPIDAGILQDNLTDIYGDGNRLVYLKDVLGLIDEQPTLTPPPITGDTSDGYHTFNELYHHRAVLFSVICNGRPDIAWKSKKHHDGTMYDGMFIVGIDTPEGQATYHYDIEPYWSMFRVKELEQAPEWDGHTPDEAIRRIGTLTRPNAPLTLDELLEMDGEPVWIVDVGPHKWYGPGWAIVDRDNCLVRTVKNWNPVFFERYGERWIAYRRPPEGGEINKITVVQHLGRLEDVALRPVSREPLEKFKEYFDDLYGKGLEIYGWHMNGEAKSFDDFYEDACEYAGL